ncbi:hypothetical protein Tco_1180304 [Tanacetum coccineum]
MACHIASLCASVCPSHDSRANIGLQIALKVTTTLSCSCSRLLTVAGEATSDGMVSGIMGDKIGEGTVEGAGEIGSEPDDHSGDGGV